MLKICLMASVLGLHLAAVGALETTGAEVCPSADGVGEYYKWTSGGTLTVPAGGKKFDLLLVGGGGAGGFCRGGGGGGGGVIYREGYTLPEGTYTIVIGAGGVPDAWTSSTRPNQGSENCYQQVGSTAATCGGNTILRLGESVVFEAIGGGGGGTFVNGNATASAGLPGGCGGGSAGKCTISPAGADGQGYAGGMALSGNDNVSGGGGGAGGPGAAAQASSASGNGGEGFACAITGASVRYAGGGGAGAYGDGSRTAGLGGGGLADAGGAGNGGTGSNKNDGMTAGVDGLGGGGGGSSGSGNRWDCCIGAKGGSGVVILREVAASKPVIDAVSASLEGKVLSLGATLVDLGTSPDGAQEGTRAIISVAVGTDPDSLDFEVVKADWTLADPVWNYEITGLSSYTTYYWALHVENEYGNALAQDVTGSVLVEGLGQALPGVASFVDPFIVYSSPKNDAYGGDPIYAIDGKADTRVDINVSGIALAYDLGEAKHVGAFRMIFPLKDVGNGYIVDRMGGLAVYGSNDKANWTLLTSQAQVGHELYGHAGEWLTYPVLVNGKFRYYEVRGLKYGNVSEMEFVAEEMGLKVDPPAVFGATDPNAADDPAGVTVSGVLTYSPSEETTIYGYWADEDFDADEAAWAAKGTRFAVTGAYKTGDVFSTKVPVAGKGRRYLRLFAQAGEEKTSSHRSWGFNVASKVAAVPCYVSHSTGQQKECLQSWYDGNVNNWCDTGTAGSVIFDLSKIPSSDYLAGIRIWPRSGSNSYVEWVRHRTMKVSVSYDAGEIVGSGATLVAGREVYQVADSSAVANWQQLDAFINDAVVPVAKVEDLMVTLPKKQRRPHYLKIENVALNNMNELELRTVKEMTGLVVIVR